MLLSVSRKIACLAVGIGLLFNNPKFLLLVLLSVYQHTWTSICIFRFSPLLKYYFIFQFYKHVVQSVEKFIQKVSQSSGGLGTHMD